MRISDWSSDVCSSDLRGPRGAAAWEGEGECRWPDQTPASPRAHAVPGPRVAPACDGGGKAAMARAAGSLSDSEISPPGAARALLRGLLLRSEEHTSELQSLMRISYAVFCLKKKNVQRK